MAGDKKSILDIVKAVAEHKQLDKEIAFGQHRGRMYNILDDTGMPTGRTEWRPRKTFTEEQRKIESNVASLKENILDESEEAPTAGGTYEGGVYYSNVLPKGKDKTPWSKEGANLVKKAAQPNAKQSDILKVQNYFVDIGYMHPSEVDGKKGKQVMGMIRRWNLNAGTSKEAMFDAMNTWKDNLFGE